jgi:hypothetical protein
MQERDMTHGDEKDSLAGALSLFVVSSLAPVWDDVAEARVVSIRMTSSDFATNTFPRFTSSHLPLASLLHRSSVNHCRKVRTLFRRI